MEDNPPLVELSALWICDRLTLCHGRCATARNCSAVNEFARAVFIESAKPKCRSTLQREAIANAQSANSRLPHNDSIFQQCVQGKETLAEVLHTVGQQLQTHKRKKSSRFLEKLQKHTVWLQNMSSAVDIVVQTHAGVACPVWAPVKFILKVRSYLGPGA